MYVQDLVNTSDITAFPACIKNGTICSSLSDINDGNLWAFSVYLLMQGKLLYFFSFIFPQMKRKFIKWFILQLQAEWLPWI